MTVAIIAIIVLVAFAIGYVVGFDHRTRLQLDETRSRQHHLTPPPRRSPNF